jgi:hypothetical protein
MVAVRYAMLDGTGAEDEGAYRPVKIARPTGGEYRVARADATEPRTKAPSQAPLTANGTARGSAQAALESGTTTDPRTKAASQQPFAEPRASGEHRIAGP